MKVLQISFYVGLALIIGFLLVGIAQVFAGYTTALVVDEQEDALKWTGEYFSDQTDPNYTINTYETTCKGYYILERTPTATRSIGYGDLADDYTYTIYHDTKSTTTPIVLDPVIDVGSGDSGL